MEADSPRRKIVQWIGFVLGPFAAAALIFFLPTQYELSTADGVQLQDFTWGGRATLGVMCWMGIWWLTEAIDLSATALLPLAVFPMLGVATMADAAAPYANHLIFLYFGGFVLALSMERWGLGKRVALVSLTLVGTSASGMIAGFMVVTAVLSAFVSNTATTAMMLPIALSTVALLREANAAARSESGVKDDSDEPSRESVFGTCLLLAIAYSASVGGTMTTIGTPTNAFLVGFLRENIAQDYRANFSFVGWLPIGLPLVLIFLPVIYFMLTRFLFPIRGLELQGGRTMIHSEIKKLGAIKIGEWNTFIVFNITVLAWLTRPWLQTWEIGLGGEVIKPLEGLTDTGIVMIAAVILFLLPVDWRRREFTMRWQEAEKLPWGILILFGGGLSLAAAVKSNGVAEFLGSFASAGALPPVLLVLAVSAAIVFLTELTSNVATTMSLVPVLAAVAVGLEVHPYLLIFPATLAASCAFMLPVATPPNAIVFGSGEIDLPEMVRAGFWLNVLSVLIVTAVTFLVVKPWLGI